MSKQEESTSYLKTKKESTEKKPCKTIWNGKSSNRVKTAAVFPRKSSQCIVSYSKIKISSTYYRIVTQHAIIWTI